MKKSMQKSVLLALLACACAAQAAAPKAITGLKTPESVVQAKDGSIYISEIAEFGKDGDGQISKVDKKGNVTVFAKGMDDPKGLAMVGDKLYVTDKTKVLEVNKNGTWRVLVDASAFPAKPQFLNDIEADKVGNLYVSDSGDLKTGGAVYKISKDGKVSTIVDSKNAEVKAPNGLLFEGRNSLLEVDFASGVLYRINMGNGEMRKVAEGFGGGDGIVKTKAGKIYVSDWQNGKVFHTSMGKARVIKENYKSAADIAITNDEAYIMVPDMKAGVLDFISLEHK